MGVQAEKDLQPWIARDDEQSQKQWRVNQRIVKLMAELMRSHDSPEALIILASASDVLLRATDGMLVDGEACTLPQLEVTIIVATSISVFSIFLFLSLAISSSHSLAIISLVHLVEFLSLSGLR